MTENGPQRAPIWKCDTDTVTGLDEIPQGGLIVFEKTLYFMYDETDITKTTTLAEAINKRKVVKMQIGGWLPKLKK